MDSKLITFISLNKKFEEAGFSLYLVGGTVRDYLLNKSLTDMDAVTDATPSDIKSFLDVKTDYSFERFGSVKLTFAGVKFDITTLREESSYEDSRHPNKIKFIKELSVDVKRRDFTLNGLYLNKNLEVIDYVNGQKDLENKTLRMIGDPLKRINEDPLRIIRAIRFSLDMDLIFEESLEKCIKENIHLLEKLNIEKIKLDLRKMNCKDKNKIHQVFANFGMLHLIDVIE